MPDVSAGMVTTMAMAVEHNMDTTGNVFATKWNSTTQLWEPSDLAHDTPIGTAVPMDITPEPPVPAPYHDTYLRDVNIGRDQYNWVELPLSFVAAHPTIDTGWQIVFTDELGAHTLTIQRTANAESQRLFMGCDCEMEEVF